MDEKVFADQLRESATEQARRQRLQTRVAHNTTVVRSLSAREIAFAQAAEKEREAERISAVQEKLAKRIRQIAKVGAEILVASGVRPTYTWQVSGYYGNNQVTRLFHPNKISGWLLTSETSVDYRTQNFYELSSIVTIGRVAGVTLSPQGKLYSASAEIQTGGKTETDPITPDAVYPSLSSLVIRDLATDAQLVPADQLNLGNNADVNQSIIENWQQRILNVTKV
jgi:hypothetical protein